MEKNIDMALTTPIKCDNCEGQIFKQVLILRRLSAIAASDGQETIIPVAVFACQSCHHVNAEFIDDKNIE